MAKKREKKAAKAPPPRPRSNIGTVIPPKRTAGGCGAKHRSAKMKRRARMRRPRVVAKRKRDHDIKQLRIKMRKSRDARRRARETACHEQRRIEETVSLSLRDAVEDVFGATGRLRLVAND